MNRFRAPARPRRARAAPAAAPRPAAGASVERLASLVPHTRLDITHHAACRLNARHAWARAFSVGGPRTVPPPLALRWSAAPRRAATCSPASTDNGRQRRDRNKGHHGRNRRVAVRALHGARRQGRRVRRRRGHPHREGDRHLHEGRVPEEQVVHRRRVLRAAREEARGETGTRPGHGASHPQRHSSPRAPPSAGAAHRLARRHGVRAHRAPRQAAGTCHRIYMALKLQR